MEFIANQSQIQNIEILPQELAQHMGEPIWIQSDSYNGWMLLTELYELVDSNGKIHSVQEIRKLNAVFSVFPPCHVYFRQIYNRYVIPETQIRNYREKMWVCINSPDPKMQELNGWYTRTPDGIGVKGKTLLSFVPTLIFGLLIPLRYPINTICYILYSVCHLLFGDIFVHTLCITFYILL